MRELTPALAASVAAHVALAVALVHTYGLPAAVADAPAPALTMTLVARATVPPPDLPALPAQAAAVVPPETQEMAAPSTMAAPPHAHAEPIAVPPPVPAPASVAETPPASENVAPSLPAASTDARVEFSVTSVLARLGDALQSRSLHEFPAEIETPVRTVDAIDVQYPPAALEERREGTVVAWVVVDASGRVEEISIPEGGPEFGEAVQNALLAARFLPAQDAGKPLRYFTMLEFRFRLGEPGATMVTTEAR